ncbi:rhamnulokinase family protein [Cohnella lubricantis]|uniref:Rhamnulokinase n=1 Tax=Cohnella lubricantis TaxID=2163172 RepID=A0A841TDR6_9BACL|nr:rhamnulokinase family protein [Cohnella lubricantis]MBB6676591.1 rhamnulokinase [Cohnella lubricantis]MBP2117398.1 rhamnulokinase [Cohnella lubricantis]
MSSILAYDLGAGSGRAVVGRLNGNRIETEELHRFANDPVQVGDRLHWDILRLYHELKQGLLKAKHQGIEVASMGIDSWAVDFGMIGANGELLGNPYHYRDRHTDGAMERLLAEVSPASIFDRTGIQFLPFNSIFQLYALKKARSPLLREAQRFLMIPDLLRYFMTGEMASEFTNATTTQLYNPIDKQWDSQLLKWIGVSESLFGPIVQPGVLAGELRPSLMEELGVPAIPVYAVAEHDTGSAVAAVPALHRSFAYLSCGTWSLMGTEVDRPVITEQARELNFTNEGGVNGTFRLLKNIMGLWVLSETRREWEREGRIYSFPELIALASQAPAFATYIDPDDDLFLPPGNMPERIRSFCERTGQKAPSEPGELVRCILESLALKYRYVLELTEQLSGQRFDGLHMVGGGVQNTLLCQWTANALGRPVWAGPAEASAIGNLAVQWIARGELADIWEARRVIQGSFPISVYEPQDVEQWENAYGEYLRKTGLSKA